MHPSLAALVAFCDGESGARRSRQITSHLSGCDKCRDRLRQVRSERDALSCGAVPSETNTQNGLAGLLSAMAAWRSIPAGPAASELRRRLRDQIETYFGSPALSVLDGPAMPAEELLGRTSDLLNVFLGPAAAERVKDDVLGGLDYARAEARR